MLSWRSVSDGDRRRFQIISSLVNSDQSRLEFLFDPWVAKLRRPAAELLRCAEGMASGDYVLMKLAVEIWCEQGDIQVHELFELEEPLLRRGLSAVLALCGVSNSLG